jgi:WD40 repeat protein
MTGLIGNVSISPDGRYIATAGNPPRVVLWDVRTFRQVGQPLPIDVQAPERRRALHPTAGSSFPLDAS